MLEHWFNGKRRKAQSVLTSRINKKALAELSDTGREIHRSSFCKVVFLIPATKCGWNVEEAVPVVSRDISTDGLSVVHTDSVTTESVLIGLIEANDLKFVRCSVQHSTELGYGFHHIGLMAVEVTNIDRRRAEVLQQKVAEWQADSQPTATC